MASQWIVLCQVDEVPLGTGKYVVVGKHGYAVFVVGDEVRVIDDNCPHAGASLSGGHLDEEGVVRCPMHNWYFDTCSGKCTDNERIGVETYESRVVDGCVEILVG